MEIVLGILFLAFSNADIQFDTECFTWRSYSIAEVLPINAGAQKIDGSALKTYGMTIAGFSI